MKKGKIRIFGIIVVIVLLVLLLSSCLNTTSYWTIDNDGNLSAILQVSPDGGITGMDNDEFTSYFQILRLIAPQMFSDSSIYSKNLSEYSERTQYTIKFNKKINVKDLDFPTTFNNDKFELTIPKLLNDDPEDSSNDIIFTLYVQFPKKVDIANTTYIEGNIAKWEITKEMIFNGVKLKAYLK